MSQFMHVETKEIVKVMNDNGKFYTLNNGVKMDKHLFSQQYAPMVNDSDNNSMNAEAFMNTKTNISVNPQNNVVTQVNETYTNTDATPVDAIDFLNSPGGNVHGIEDIKNLDPSKIIGPKKGEERIVRDLSQEESAIQTTNQSMQDQRQILLEKHKNMGQIQVETDVDLNDPASLDNMMRKLEKPAPRRPINENGLSDIQENMRQQQIELTGEDPYAEKIKKYRSSKGLHIEPVRNPKMTNDTIEDIQPVQNEQQTTQTQQVEDPTTALFKKFKRNHKLVINLKIKDKISKPDFIKVMADGLEGDIIQYYADEIFRKFLNDFNGIKTEIYNQIYEKVYGCLPEIEEIEDEEVTIGSLKIGLDLVKVKTNKELGIGNEEKVLIMIPGKPTKTNKPTFKYINGKGKVVDMIPLSAEKKGYQPATKKDLK